MCSKQSLKCTCNLCCLVVFYWLWCLCVGGLNSIWGCNIIGGDNLGVFMSITIVGTSSEIESTHAQQEVFTHFRCHEELFKHYEQIVDWSCKAFFNLNMAIAMYVVAHTWACKTHFLSFVLFWSSFIVLAPCSRCKNLWSLPLLFGSTTLE